MAPSKYSITVAIEAKTLAILRADPHKVLVLVRDIGVGGGEVDNGNIVFATYDSKDLSATQTFIWEEAYSVSETTDEFKVSVFILWLVHTIDDWHVARFRSQVRHAGAWHHARTESRVQS